MLTPDQRITIGNDRRSPESKYRDYTVTRASMGRLTKLLRDLADLHRIYLTLDRFGWIAVVNPPQTAYEIEQYPMCKYRAEQLGLPR